MTDNAAVDHGRVNDAATKVGDHLEEQRQHRLRVEAERAVLGPLWDKLRAPFPAEDQEKLPKVLSAQDKDKAECRQGTRASADGYYCGGYHARAIHLDYIGHAGITMRLNEVVGPENWDLQPLAYTPDGLPLFSRTGEFWVRLTILGVPKIDLAENFKSTQEAWGDGLRRAASRFGIGTYLWAKSERALALRNPDMMEATAEQARRDKEEAERLQLAAATALLTKALDTTVLTEVQQVWREAQAKQLLGVEVEHMDGSKETLDGALRRHGNSLGTTT